MTIVTLGVEDVANPIEVQTWLDEHSSVTIINIWSIDSLFYIVYE